MANTVTPITSTTEGQKTIEEAVAAGRGRIPWAKEREETRKETDEAAKKLAPLFNNAGDPEWVFKKAEAPGERHALVITREGKPPETWYLQEAEILQPTGIRTEFVHSHNDSRSFIQTIGNGYISIRQAIEEAIDNNVRLNPDGIDKELVDRLKQSLKEKNDPNIAIAMGEENRFKARLTLTRDGGKQEVWYLQKYYDNGSLTLVNKKDPDVKIHGESKNLEGIITQVKAHDGKGMIEKIADQINAIKEKHDIAGITLKEGAGREYTLFLKRQAQPTEGWKLRYEQGSLIFTDTKDPNSIVLDHSFKAETILRKLQDANIERDDPANVQGFDLTREHPIGYVAFSGMDDKENRKNFKKTTEAIQALPELLARCGYKMVCLGEERLVYLKDKPENTVRTKIDDLHAQGIRHFFLNFHAHGNKTGIYPQWDKTSKDDPGTSKLSSEQMKTILTDPKYKDCSFTLKVSACRAGGFIKMMREIEDFPGANRKIALLVTTKEDDLQAGKHYDNVFMSLLQDMADKAEGAPKNIGQTHYRTDKNTQHIEVYTPIERNPLIRMNPEFWISVPGERSLRTARHDPMEHTDPMAKAIEQYHAGHMPREPAPSEPQHGLSKDASGQGQPRIV